jgi:arginase
VAKDDTKFILILGGDHSIAVGSLAAAMKTNPDVVIIWVDAHADINTPSTSLSGYYHGMPLGFAMRLDGADEPYFQWLNDYPALKPENLVYIGLRDLDPAERVVLKELNIKSYNMSDIDRMGIGRVMKEVVKWVDDRPMHVSFDIDACDPFFASATGTKVRGGLSFRESHFICESLASTNNLASMDIVEVNPELLYVEPKSKESTYFAAISLVESCLGRDILK